MTGPVDRFLTILQRRSEELAELIDEVIQLIDSETARSGTAS